LVFSFYIPDHVPTGTCAIVLSASATSNEALTSCFDETASDMPTSLATQTATQRASPTGTTIRHTLVSNCDRKAQAGDLDGSSRSNRAQAIVIEKAPTDEIQDTRVKRLLGP